MHYPGPAFFEIKYLFPWIFSLVLLATILLASNNYSVNGLDKVLETITDVGVRPTAIAYNEDIGMMFVVNHGSESCDPPFDFGEGEITDPSSVVAIDDLNQLLDVDELVWGDPRGLLFWNCL